MEEVRNSEVVVTRTVLIRYRDVNCGKASFESIQRFKAFLGNSMVAILEYSTPFYLLTTTDETQMQGTLSLSVYIINITQIFIK
jgi:hypothetical protein